MMVLAPMTFIVVLVLILSVFVGIVLIVKALGGSGGRRPSNQDDIVLGTKMPCRHCGHVNPTHAKFCAHCGKPLN